MSGTRTATLERRRLPFCLIEASAAVWGSAGRKASALNLSPPCAALNRKPVEPRRPLLRSARCKEQTHFCSEFFPSEQTHIHTMVVVLLERRGEGWGRGAGGLRGVYTSEIHPRCTAVMKRPPPALVLRLQSAHGGRRAGKSDQSSWQPASPPNGPKYRRHLQPGAHLAAGSLRPWQARDLGKEEGDLVAMVVVPLYWGHFVCILEGGGGKSLLFTP